MRSHTWGIAHDRGALPFHVDDHAPHAHRLSEGRVEIHTDRRGQIAHAAGRHGFAAQTRVRAAGVGGVAAENPKFQSPSTREAPIIKLQKLLTSLLMFGIWLFPGVWCLGFGVSQRMISFST